MIFIFILNVLNACQVFIIYKSINYLYFIFRLYLLLGKYESNMVALKLEVETGEEIMNCYSSLLSIYDGSASEEEKK